MHLEGQKLRCLVNSFCKCEASEKELGQLRLQFFKPGVVYLATFRAPKR